MTVQYVNTTPSQPISLYPRAVYRVVVERDGFVSLSYLTGALRWRQVVEGMIDRSSSPAGFPLGGGLDNITNDDTTAVVDYRAGSNPGSLTVSALVQAIEDATPYTQVVSITRLGTVPPISQGGPGVLAAGRDQAQDAAQAKSDAESFTARATSYLGSLGRYAALGLGVAVVAVLVYLYRPSGKGGSK